MSNVDNSIIPFYFLFEDSSKQSQSQKEQASHKNKDKESNLDFTQSEFTQNSSNNFQLNLFNLDEQQMQNDTLVLSQDEKEKQNINNCALETVLDKIHEQQDEILQNDQEKNPFNINCFKQLNKNENFQKSISFEQGIKDITILKQFEVASNAKLHQSICHNLFSKQCIQNKFPILPKEVDSQEQLIGESDKLEQKKDEIQINEIEQQQREKTELKTLVQLKAQRAQQPKLVEEKTIKKGIRLVDDKKPLKQSLTEKRKFQLKTNLKLDTLKQQHCRQNEINSSHWKQMETKPIGQTSWQPLSMEKKAQSSVQLNLPVIKIEEKTEEKCKLPPKQNRLDPKKNISKAQGETIQLVHNIINIEKSSIKKENSEQETTQLCEKEQQKQMKESNYELCYSNIDKNSKQLLSFYQDNLENENQLSARSQLQMKSNYQIPLIQQQTPIIKNQYHDQQQNQTNVMNQNTKNLIKSDIPQQASINSLMEKYKNKRQNSVTNFRNSKDRFIQQNIVKQVITKDNKQNIAIEDKNPILVIQDTKKNNQQQQIDLQQQNQVLRVSALNYQQEKQNQKIKTDSKEECNQENKSEVNTQKQQHFQILKITQNENNQMQKDLNYYRNKYKRNNSSQPESTPAKPKHCQQPEQTPQSASKGQIQIEKNKISEEMLQNIEINYRKQFSFINKQQISEKFQVKTYEEMVSELNFKKQRQSRISNNLPIKY